MTIELRISSPVLHGSTAAGADARVEIRALVWGWAFGICASFQSETGEGSDHDSFEPDL
jgi:hypothetical protein